jgi:hypothetical protein
LIGKYRVLVRLSDSQVSRLTVGEGRCIAPRKDPIVCWIRNIQMIGRRVRVDRYIAAFAEVQRLSGNELGGSMSEVELAQLEIGGGVSGRSRRARDREHHYNKY